LDTCSFCGRPESVVRLVFGPTVAICEHCARLVTNCFSSGEETPTAPTTGGGVRLTESSAPEGIARSKALPSGLPTDDAASDSSHHTLEGAARAVVRLRFGLGLDRPHTLAETAQKLGLERAQVRRIEAQFLFEQRRSR
jgi:hypothetical protein